MGKVLFAVGLFTSILVALVCLIMATRAALIPSGDVTIRVNDSKRTKAKSRSAMDS